MTFAIALLVVGSWSQDQRKLDAIVSAIEERFQNVHHITASELEKLGPGPEVLILDAREPAEFQVSRISGAQHVSPAASASALMKVLQTHPEAKSIVVYCAVGARSSTLATRLQRIVSDNQKVSNLKGGIFTWHNDNRPLVNAQGKTDFVHPYNARWGQLLNRKSKARPRI